jgi:hypothetical protein
MRYTALLLFVWSCGLAACGVVGGKPASGVYIGLVNAAEVQEVYLSDHTHCAVIFSESSASQTSAISCDWGSGK